MVEMATLGVFAAREVAEAARAVAEVQGSSDATIGALGGKVLPSVDGLASPFSTGRLKVA
jgi:hypothetical protein